MGQEHVQRQSSVPGSEPNRPQDQKPLPVATAKQSDYVPHPPESERTSIQTITVPKDKASQSPATIRDTKKTSIPIGQELLRQGLISKDQLETALKEQQRQGDTKKMLGSILVDMGFITESALSEVLTESSGIKSFNLKKAVLDPKLIKQIPREVAIRYKAVPVMIEDDVIRVAIADVYNILAIDQISRYFPAHLKIIPVYSSEADLLEAIDQYYGYETSIGGILREIESGISDKHKEVSGEQEGYINPTVRLVDAILVDAIKRDASDIHFEPEGAFLRLRYRIDGKLIQIRSFHKDYWPAIAVRIKIMANMNIAETRLPQDGRTSYYVLGRDIDFRVATHPTIFGENIVMRILDKHKSLVSMDKLGFSKHNEQLLKRLLRRPEGIIIVTGPTGSGKTTTLYSILHHINSVDINIMTLENPVEYQLTMLRQSDVREDKGMDFVMGIKSLLRQDPDVIFVGEIRDEATANMAMRAAMTGHRVFSTLHTNDALGALPRLIDIGIPPYLLAGSLICVMAQRLVRRLCSHCKEEALITEEEARIMRIPADEGRTMYHPKGCEKCLGSGYKGRIAVHEIVPIDKGLDELIANSASRKVMLECALEKGFVSMVQDGIEKVLQGVTDIEELIRTIDMTERL